MRKVLRVLVLFMACFLSGCGISVKQVNNDVTNISISSGDYRNFINIGTDKQDISAEEYFSVRGPLVKKKIIQNESGQVVQIVVYDYDDKNCYSKIETSQYNTITGNMEVSFIDEYSYDEYFSYHTQTVMSKKCESRYEVRDTHENTILLRIDNGYDSQIITYTYDYTCDTDLRHEEYCYSGEGMTFCYYLVSSYNKNGDEISCIIQDSDGEYTFHTTEYVYDTENRIVKRTETRTDKKSIYYTSLNETTVYISEYSYNADGLLECEIYTVINNKGDYDEDENVLMINFEYDTKGRLIKEIHEGVNSQIIYYEYDEISISGNEDNFF